MRLFSLFLGASALLFSASACSKKCKTEPPRAKIVNNGTGKASVQIMTTGGNTVNINNILVGTQSDWASYAAGDVQFTISIQDVSPDAVLVVPMNTCWEYEIQIDSANNVSSLPTEREKI